MGADAVVLPAQRAVEAMMHDESEVVLSPRVSSHDRDREFVDFMASSARDLARVAWYLSGDEHRAEELVQQALMKTYLGWSRAREGDAFGYARRALVTSRIDSWRRVRREWATAPADLPDRADPASGDTVALRDVLARALGQLTMRQRRVVVLRFFLGMSEQEVADDLGVSVGTVKTTAFRALRRLRGTLTLDDEPDIDSEGSAR